MKTGKNVEIKLVYSNGEYSNRVRELARDEFFFQGKEEDYGTPVVTGEDLGRGPFRTREEAAVHCEVDRYISENHGSIDTALWGLTGGNMHILKFPGNAVVILGKSVPMSADEEQDIVAIHATEQALQQYVEGALVQEAFPELDKEEREFIISGIKPEKCGSFSALFPIPGVNQNIPF
jgi:hypothetical protein